MVRLGGKRTAKAAGPPVQGRFLNRLILELKLEEWSPESMGVLNERFIRHYMAEERPDDRTPITQWTPRQIFFGDIFQEFFGISHAKLRLEQASKFLQGLKSSRTSGDVISYHVEKHFEEIYAFKNRTIAFLRRLAKLLRKRNLRGHALGLKDIEAVVERACKGPVAVRGTHAHESRFRDEDIERVGSLDLIARRGGLLALEPLRRQQTRRALTKWRKTTAANVDAVDKLMEAILGVVEPIIFDQLAPPSGIDRGKC